MKNPLQETTRYFKKIVKDRNSNYYVQAVDDTIYMTEGHMIAKMPAAAYNAFIVPNIAGLPAWDHANFNIGGSAGMICNKDCRLDQRKIIESRCLYGTVTAESWIVEHEDLQARVFLWEDGGKTTGTVINETFYKIGLELGNEKGIFEHGSPREPLYTWSNNTAAYILPIAGVAGFDRLLELLNKKEGRLIA